MQKSITTGNRVAARPGRFAGRGGTSRAGARARGRHGISDRPGFGACPCFAIARAAARLVLVLATLVVWTSAAHAASWSVRDLLAQTALLDPSHEVPLADGDKIDHARVLHLRRLRDVHAKIAASAEIQTDLRIVPSATLNALAVYRPPTIVITTAMLRLVGDDESMLAALLGHEFAHIGLRHSARAAGKAAQNARVGIQTGRQVAIDAGDTSQATKAAVLVFLLLQAEFSREQEAEADRVGTQFLARARFDPDGTIRLLRAMIAQVGSRPTRYLDTHPGLEERISQAEPAVVNEHFRMLAERLHQSRNWVRLLRATDYWLTANENAASAWYYRGQSLKALGRHGALDAFQQAVNKHPDLPSARLALCIELYESGNIPESLLCSEHLKRSDEQAQFEARTFGHPTHVYRAGRSPTRSKDPIRIIRE